MVRIFEEMADMGYPSSKDRDGSRRRRLRLLVLCLVCLGGAWALTDEGEWERVSIALGIAEPPDLPPRAVGSVVLDPAWTESAFEEFDAAHPCPRLRLLAYREGLAAGLRFLHGIEAVPADGPDHAASRDWRLAAGPGAAPDSGKPVDFTLVFTAVPSRRVIEIRLARADRREVIRTLQDLGRTIPLDGGADLALADLPRVLEILGHPPEPPMVATTPDETEPWSPGNLTRFALALRPLARQGAASSAPALARAARALAWQALLDHRLAPVLAPTRAAQALALAAVAEQRAGGPTGETREVRWLAPAAALEDFLLLARNPPPREDPGLLLLHRSLLAPDLPGTKPSRWGLAELIALTQRAAALGHDHAHQRFLEWSLQGTDLDRVAPGYLGRSWEFGTVAAAASLAPAAPLHDLAAIRDAWKPAGLPPGTDAILASWTASGPGVESLWVPDVGKVAALLPFAKALIESARGQDSWAGRILVQELGEHVLASIHLPICRYAYLHMPRQKKTLQGAVSALGDWPHIEIQRMLAWDWLMDRNDLGPVTSMEARRAYTAAMALPGLLRTEDAGRFRSCLGHAGWEYAKGLLHYYPDHPGHDFRFAWSAVAAGSRGIGLAALLELRRRTHPLPLNLVSGRIQFLNRRCAGWFQDDVPEPYARIPDVALRRASSLVRRGLPGDAGTILDSMFRDDRSHTEVASRYVTHLTRQGQHAEADRAFQEMMLSGPGGLEWAQLAVEVKRRHLRDGRIPDAMTWSERAASSGAAWALEGHASMLIRTGRHREIPPLVQGYRERYGESSYLDDLKTISHALATKRDGGWDALAPDEIRAAHALNQGDLDLLDPFLAPAPEGTDVRRLKFRIRIRDVAWVADDGVVSLQDVAALVREYAALDPGTRQGLPAGAGDWIHELLAQALADESRAGRGGLVSADQLAPIVRLLEGSLPVDRLAGMLRTASERGIEPAGLVPLVEAALPLIPDSDRAIARALFGDEARLGRWLAVGYSDDPIWELKDLLKHEWMSGRVREARDLARTVVRSAKDRPPPIFPVLVLLAGDVEAAQQWLGAEVGSRARDPRWGRSNECHQEAEIAPALGRLRPPGAPASILEIP